MILGGRAGFFRVGDWNVNGWDQQQNGLGGDFVCGKWPAFRAGDQNAVVIGGMRGVAVPENSPSKTAAIDFARFLLTREAQALSLKHVGSAVRSDIEMEPMSERRMYFARQRDRLVAYDFPESILEYYPQLEANYHRKLLTAIASPPASWDSFVAQTAEELQAFANQNSRR
jgi:ABC-type glycerol-3-phosphate transport system substrate-binding protein